jgi:hypothetical protein
MHPLAPNLQGLSMEELLTKYNELTKRLNQAYRSGPYQIIPQIQMMIDHYQSEISERNAKQLAEMNKRAEDSGKGFKGIIDIS